MTSQKNITCSSNSEDKTKKLEISNPSAVKSFGRVLQCFSKVTEFISLRLKQDSLTVHSLSTGRSVGMECTFVSSFFQSFPCGAANNTFSSSWTDTEVITVSSKHLLTVFRTLSTIQSLQMCINSSSSKLVLFAVSQSKIRKTYSIPLEQNVVSRVVYSIATCSCRLSARPKMLQELFSNFENKLEELQMVADKRKLWFFSSDKTRLSTRKSVRFRTCVSVDATEFDEYWVHWKEQAIRLGFPFAVLRQALELAEQLNALFYIHFDQAGVPMILAIRIRGECLLDIDFVVSTRKLSLEETNHFDKENFSRNEEIRMKDNASSNTIDLKPYVPLHDESIHLFSSNTGGSCPLDFSPVGNNSASGENGRYNADFDEHHRKTASEEEEEEFVEGTPP
eukprot:jgi/Galph1/4005/GphlegSOOS_G2683.1